MTVRALPAQKSQLTLDFEPGMTERFPSAMDCLRAAIYGAAKPMKTIAADMDMSTSSLSRKLSQDPDDPRRFSLDDLERYIAATGDTSVVEYLAVRYLESDERRHARMVTQAERLLTELAAVLPALKGAA
jgi:hypothetical protein